MTYFKELGWIPTMDDVRKKEKLPAYHIIVGIAALIIFLLTIKTL